MQNRGRRYYLAREFPACHDREFCCFRYNSLRKEIYNTTTGRPGYFSCFVSLTVPDSVVTVLKILLNSNGEKESYLNSRYICGDAVVSVLY